MRRYKSERGAALIMVALSLVLLLSFLALTVDVGVGYAERRKMQNAADAAALAGSIALTQAGATGANVKVAIDSFLAANGANALDSAANPSAANWLYRTSTDPAAAPIVGAAVGSGAVPAGTTGVHVVARGSANTFFARVPGLISRTGIAQMTTGATAGGEFQVVDIVVLVGRSGNSDDDACSNLRSAFLPTQACYQLVSGKPLGGAAFQGIVNSKSCPLCKGVWSTTDAKCHVSIATGPLMSPAPAGCTVTNATGCAACSGVWGSVAQPLANDKTAAVNFINQVVQPNVGNITHMAFVQYYGTCADKASPTLTSDLTSVATAITKLGGAGQENANIACAINTAVAEFDLHGRPTASRYLLLVSDGITNLANSGYKCNSCSYPQCCPQAIADINASVANAVNHNVHISVVGQGSVADTTFLQGIADQTGGLMFYSGASLISLSNLQAIYAQMLHNYKLRLTE
jgi:Flp pilus assembly protein TadG